MHNHYWLNDDSRAFLARGYLKPEQTAEDRISDIAENAEHILGKKGFAEKFKHYMAQGFFSLASPVWANFGTERGLPISCNNSFIEDTTESILMKTAEIGMMTKFGAGTSAYIGALRPRGAPISGGGISNGSVHFMELLETTTDVISQSNVRRGSCAVYLDVESPDIMEFLDCREEGSAIQNLSLGVCITNAWMEDMIDGDEKKRKVWVRIIQKRFESGYPYIFWTDNVNDGRPDVYKIKNMPVFSSNLCTEIALPSNPDESFVCDLASMNLLRFDEWAETDAVETLTYFLDAVMSEYIDKIKDEPLMQAAYNFAVRHRAIGIGGLGWHSYLQSKMIPYESMEAKLLNARIWQIIDERSLEASKIMAIEYGEPEVLKGFGMRNTTRLAVAPTTSSSFILGQVSPSLEPENSNYYTKDLQKGKFTYRNPYLEALLAEKGQNTEEVWREILLAGGSVQDLECLTQEERDVFKTFGEIDQYEIIVQAAQRQKFIDQGQSTNLMIHPDTSLKDVNKLMVDAWKLGIKTLYYQRGTNPAQELARSLIGCVSCEA